MSTTGPSNPDAESLPRTNMISRALDSLRISRDFRYLWFSNLFFVGGNWALVLILSWQVFDITDSEEILGIFAALRMAPLLLGPFSGLLADRYDRVGIVKILSVWPFLIIVLLAVLVGADMAPYPVLLAGGLLLGLAPSPSQPARSSLMLQMVGRDRLANAAALNNLAVALMQGVAPALAGVLISRAGVTTSLWVSSVWFLIASILIWQIRERYDHQIRAQHDSVLHSVVDGLRIVFTNRLSGSVMTITLASTFLVFPIYSAFMPVFASDVLGLGADGLGWLLMCNSIGSVTGSLVMASLGDIRHKGAVFIAGNVLWASAWAAFGLSEIALLSFGIQIIGGLVSVGVVVLQTPLTLMTSPPEVQGRALGLLEFMFGAMPIGSLLLGVIAGRWGVGLTTFGASVLFIVIMAVYLVFVPDLLRYTGEEEAS